MRSLIVGTVCLLSGCGGETLKAEARSPAESAPLRDAATAKTDAPAQVADPLVTQSGDAAEKQTLEHLRHARALLRTFLEKAGSEPAYAEAVRRATTRVEDLTATIDFIEQGLREREATSQ